MVQHVECRYVLSNVFRRIVSMQQTFRMHVLVLLYFLFLCAYSSNENSTARTTLSLYMLLSLLLKVRLWWLLVIGWVLPGCHQFSETHGKGNHRDQKGNPGTKVQIPNAGTGTGAKRNVADTKAPQDQKQ